MYGDDGSNATVENSGCKATQNDQDCFMGRRGTGPDQSKVSAYYNLDNGSGKVRGIFLQENEALRPIFEKWMEPFADLGATSVKSGNTGFTDHYTFDVTGMPGFEFIQDPLEYLTRTHHSNMDVYDHLAINDLKQAATAVSYTHLRA